ncbi:MAG: hypothetical protein ACI4L7_00580 [Christensenellales bacterium]
MERNFRKTKKALVALALSATCVLSGVPMLRSSHFPVQAYYYQSVKTDIIKNGDFTVKTDRGDNFPASLSGNNWTVSVPEDISCGVIDTENSSYNYGLSVKPKPSTNIKDADKYILMFRGASEATGATSGHVTSDSATLENDKFYEISVYAMTQGTGAGTIYSPELDMSLPVTTKEWNKYSFYVQTDSFDTKAFTLQLKFSKGTTSGAVFYDHITVSEVAEADYLGAVESDSCTKKSFQRTMLTSYKNANFESGLDFWTVSGGNGESDIYVNTKEYIDSQINTVFESTGIKSESFDGTSSSTKSLLFINKKSVVESKKISSITDEDSAKDNSLTIYQHGLYRLSFVLKTGGDTSGLKVTLSPTNEKLSSKAITQSELKGTSSSDARNGFSVVSFYIQGSSARDEKVALEMSIGTEKGWAVVDNIVLEAITSTEFSSKKSSSNTLDLSSMTDTSDIQNGQFNFATIDSLSSSYTIGLDGSILLNYPLTPASWNISKSSSERLSSGIVRVGNYSADSIRNPQDSYGTITNPGANSAFYKDFYNLNKGDYSENEENILMVRSSTAEDVSFSSSSVTLSANSRSNQSKTTFFVGVNTYDNAKAYAKLVDKNGKTLAIFDNIQTNGTWKQYYFYVTNGISSTDVKMVVGVHGNTNTTQCAFFDCAGYLSSEKVVENATSLSLNLLENNFEPVKKDGNKRSQDAIGFETIKVSNKNECSAKIYNKLDDPDLSTIPTSTSVLTLHNIFENSYQTISTNYTYSLKKDNYYKFSAWIRTDDLVGEGAGIMEVVTLNSEGKIVADEENKNVFKRIITPTPEEDDENNGYKQYTIYLLAEADQEVKVCFSLGTAESTVVGKMYISNFVVSDVESSEYIGKTSDDYTIVSKVVEKTEDTTDETEDEHDHNHSADINIWALASSILLVVALGFAIAGYLLRRVPKKQKKEKVKKVDYKNSPKAINEKQIKAELKTKREESLENLNEQLSTLQAEYDQLQSEYETKCGNDENVDAKLYSEYTKKLNKIKERIEYLNSAVAYLKNNQVIRYSEKTEIKNKKKQVEKEFNALKNSDGKKNKPETQGKKKR